MLNRWRQLSKQAKIAIVAVVLFIVAIVGLALLFPNQSDQPIAEPGAFEVSVDPTSGEETNTGQGTPEEQDIPGAPVFFGLSAFLDRGMDADAVDIIRQAMSGFFVVYDPEINSVSLSPNITHTRSDDGFSTYTTTMALNGDDSYQLVIKTDSIGYLLITMSRGDELQTIFDSNNAYSN